MDEEPSEEIVVAELIEPKPRPAIRPGFVLGIPIMLFSITICGGFAWFVLWWIYSFFDYIFSRGT